MGDGPGEEEVSTLVIQSHPNCWKAIPALLIAIAWSYDSLYIILQIWAQTMHAWCMLIIYYYDHGV